MKSSVKSSARKLEFEVPEVFEPLLKPARYKGAYGGRGSGKCLALGTPVTMADGTIKAVEEIRSGNQVMGPDGLPRNVLGTTFGYGKLFEVRQNGGETYIVNESHKISLKRAKTDRYPSFGPIANVTPAEFIGKSNRWKAHYRGYRAGPIELPKKNLVIPPYVFGAWLGDGCSDRQSITSMDEPIIEEFVGWGDSLGCHGVRRKKPGQQAHTIILTNIQGRSNPAKERLRQLGVLGNKHVPIEYQTSSIDDRLEFLAGFIDTDGFRDGGSGYVIAQKSEPIIRAVKRIAGLCGFRTSLRPKPLAVNGEIRIYWNLNISGAAERIPCRLPRKQTQSQPNKDWLCGAIEVKPIEDGWFAGFELDGDHLFLLGDCTVTHNSHFFAERVIDDSLAIRGLRTVCIREVQRTLAQSSKLLIEDKLKAHRVGEADGFKVFEKQIETPGDGLIIFQGMQDHTAESIKSLEGFNRAWMEEAQAISTRSLELLRPTIRAPGSEVWASWNPRRKTDAVDEFFRGTAAASDPEIIAVSANWRDNPWFPKELQSERERDRQRYPDRYSHIWEGDYARALAGAYYSRDLQDARAQGRITRVGPDYTLPIRAFFDIGGSGAQSDATAIWVVQFVSREIRVLDYIESVGQAIGYHASELHRRGWARALIILPHDGVNNDNIIGKRYADHWKDAGFTVPEPIKNQGKGAAMMRIEAARRHFPVMWFNEATTEAGRDCLGYYHEKKDEVRGVGLGPEHDFSSHAADAFGLMAVCYEQFEKERDRHIPPTIPSWSNPIATTGMLG